MQTSIILSSEDNTGRTLQKTLTFANASASSGVLKTLAQKLNGLTTNIYKKTDRVQKLNCDTEEIPTVSGGFIDTTTNNIPGPGVQEPGDEPEPEDDDVPA